LANVQSARHARATSQRAPTHGIFRCRHIAVSLDIFRAWLEPKCCASLRFQCQLLRQFELDVGRYDEYRRAEYFHSKFLGHLFLPKLDLLHPIGQRSHRSYASRRTDHSHTANDQYSLTRGDSISSHHAPAHHRSATNHHEPGYSLTPTNLHPNIFHHHCTRIST
jgi:hypothetical protein